MTLQVSPSQFGCSDVGFPRPAALIAQSSSGLTSSCPTTVRVHDMITPTINCRSSVGVTLDAFGQGTLNETDVYVGQVVDPCGVGVRRSAPRRIGRAVPGSVKRANGSFGLAPATFSCSDVGVANLVTFVRYLIIKFFFCLGSCFE